MSLVFTKCSDLMLVIMFQSYHNSSGGKRECTRLHGKRIRQLMTGVQ